MLPLVFEKYRNEIDAELKSLMNGRQSPLYGMMRYHFGWVDEEGNSKQGSVGKALRATLCLLSCEAVGGEHYRALAAAAAVELVHNYSLIHDDIQDDDRERRHRPTVWSIWGKPQAINAGTAMRLLANKALTYLGKDGITLEKQSRIQHLMDEASLQLIEGQYLDISYESRSNVGVNDYLKMIEGKTAALLACASEVGALLGTEDKNLVESFHHIGWNLGLAFQIRDDILGIWGDEKETGKSSASDIRRCKKTLPVIYALENTSDGLQNELINIYRNGTLDDTVVSRVLEILNAVDARNKTQAMIEYYSGRAWQIIDSLALVQPAKRDLEGLVRFLVERRF